MDIILYDNVITLSELNSSRALKDFVTLVEIKQEKALEMEAFLEALSNVNLPMVAHVSVERSSNGEKVEVVFTSKQKDNQGSYVVVWGTGTYSSPESDEYTEIFKLDFDVSKTKELNPRDFFIKKKNMREWFEHFVCLFSRIRYKQTTIMIEVRKIVSCLVSPP